MPNLINYEEWQEARGRARLEQVARHARNREAHLQQLRMLREEILREPNGFLDLLDSAPVSKDPNPDDIVEFDA